MAGAQSQALATAALISFVCSCKTIVVHYERSADRRHLIRVLEQGIDQYVERDGQAEPSYRAIGVESLIVSADGAHVAYPGLSGSGWEVVHDGEASRAWRGIGEIAMSEDGAHLAYAALDDQGWRVVHDGRLGPIADSIMRNTLVLSPDGTRLAYAAERAGISYLHCDDQVFGGFSSIGRPIFSADSARLAFAAARGRSLRVVLDGEQQAPFEEIVELSFVGGRLGYFGLRGDRWHAVIDGAVGPPFELAASMRVSPGGSVAYLAKEERWHLIVNGEKRASHDEIAHRTLCFTGEVPRFSARDGASWSAGGRTFDAIEGPICSGDRWAYLGRSGDRSIVMDGDREAASLLAADVPVLSAGGRKLAFIGVDEKRAFVQIEERAGAGVPAREEGRRITVKMPVFGTLVLSPDGEHFGLMSADREQRHLDLIVDGRKRKRFDFEEPAALALKGPRALPDDAVRRWVSAELALHLEEAR